MKHSRTLLIALTIWGSTAALGLLAATEGFDNDSPQPPRPNPAKVVGHDSCARCHQQEIKQWQSTPHYRTFDVLHRAPEAKAIADRLGLRSVKRNETCVQCHYTQQEVRGRDRVVAGISCESCHGAGADWLEMHADYGGATKESESAEHKQRRREASIAAGMNNPGNVYLIARQCLGCHTTPNEQLVNVGGHAAGTPDFELVAWSQGMVRHNFQRGGGENAPSKLSRVRVMYVVGALADLEYSLRAAAKATTADKFGTAAATRAAKVKRRLWDMQRKLDLPLLDEALDAVSDLELKLGNSESIAAAAERIGSVGMRFAETVHGEELTAIDSLLPAPSTYKY